MSLQIRAVRENGILEKERLVLSSDSNEDIGQYILFATKKIDEGQVSGKVRQTLWLPDYKVEAGDLVVVYTKASTKRLKEKKNDDNTKTVFIYWGLDKPLWNEDVDTAALIKIDEWNWKKVV